VDNVIVVIKDCRDGDINSKTEADIEDILAAVTL